MSAAECPPARRLGGLPAIGALLLYLALGLHFVEPGLFGGQVLSAAGIWTRGGPFPPEMTERLPPELPLMGDTVFQYIPWLRYAVDGWQRDGRIPLWKDTASCGAPFVGNGQSATFFPTVLSAILLGAPAWVYAAQALAKLVGGALCAWLLARHLGLSFLASFAAGLVFGFGGFQVVWLGYTLTNVSLFLPLLLLAADRVALAPSFRNVGLLGVVAGLQHLGGHPETAFHCQTAAMACAALRSFSLRHRDERWRVRHRIGAAAGGLLLGAGIGAIQILPLLEYMSQSDMLQSRMQRGDWAVLQAPWWCALLVVSLVTAAFAFRRLATGRRPWLAAAVLFAATVAGLMAAIRAGMIPVFLYPLASDWYGDPRRGVGPVNYIEYNGAFAGVALPLAVLGLIHGRPRGPVKVLGGLLAVGLLLGFHAPVLADALEALPIFRLAANERLNLLSLVATALLAGFGLDALGGVARAAWSRSRVALGFFVPALGAVAAIAVGVSTGQVTSPNVPVGDAALPRLEATLLPEGTGTAWQALLPRLRPCEDGGLAPDEGFLVSGIVHVARPLVGLRLVYGGDHRSVVARTLPLSAVWPPGKPPPPDAGTARFVFNAVVPSGDFLPEPSRVQVWAMFKDGTTSMSRLLPVPGAAGPSVLPYPARPAPGREPGQLASLAAVALIVLLTLHVGGRWRAPVRAGFVVLLGAGLHGYVAGLVQVLPPDLFYPSSPALSELARLPPDGRMLGMEVYRFQPELATAYGIPDVMGYDALYPRRVVSLLRAALEPPGTLAAMPALPRRADPDLGLLGLMAVKQLAAYGGGAVPMEVKRFAFGPDPCNRPFLIATNPAFLPRARLVGGAVIEFDDERALERLHDPDVLQGRSVVLAAGEARVAPGGGLGAAEIVVNRPDHVRVSIAPAAPGWLVLADTFFPGWVATVDGAEREILRANVAFRAVPVRPGDRSVDFRYEPLSFKVGSRVTLLACALALCGIVLRRRASRLESAQPPG